jgi:hypothetical protein
MSFGINVQGGTGAGRRIVKPMPEAWECDICDRTLKAHWSRCPGCGSPRPH